MEEPPSSSSGVKNSIPLILLDVDGVLNSKRMKRLWKDALTSDYVFVINVVDEQDLVTIQYSPTVVETINQWSSSGLAEVRWLTNWNGQANTVLAPVIGVKEFGLARESNSITKPDAFLNSIDCNDPDRLVIWIDDHLPTYKKEVGKEAKYKSGIFNRSSTVLVAPLSGLSKSQLEYVDRIVRNPQKYRGKRCVVNFEAGNRGIPSR